MERTIDGIDYIAKSEVLRIIDEEMVFAHRQIKHPMASQHDKNGWDCRLVQLRVLRALIANPQER